MRIASLKDAVLQCNVCSSVIFDDHVSTLNNDQHHASFGLVERAENYDY